MVDTFKIVTSSTIKLILTGSCFDLLQGIQSTQINSTSDVYGKGRSIVVL